MKLHKTIILTSEALTQEEREALRDAIETRERATPSYTGVLDTGAVVELEDFRPPTIAAYLSGEKTL